MIKRHGILVKFTKLYEFQQHLDIGNETQGARFHLTQDSSQIFYL